MTTGTSSAQILVKRKVILMGSQFEFTVSETDSATANGKIDKAIEEVKRIENLISEWDSTTQISTVNRNAGIHPVVVDREVFELTQRAIAYSKLSDGAFDISIAALDKVWIFDGSMDSMPSSQQIRNSINQVGYQYIRLDSVRSTLFLVKKGMKIGFGSIGKGYAADKASAFLQSMGVPGGIVNASGDLAAWGTQPGSQPWLIGISNPFKPAKVVQVLKIRDGSVATSGSYQKYAEINGRRYSHIIDPRTGYPSTGVTSVTITGPSAEFANALSTSVMVLGEKDGIKLVEQFSGYKYIIITDGGKVRKSRKMMFRR